MRLEAKTDSGDPANVILANVYSGIGIETDMGLFGIAQRDDGIEVQLNGKSVWTSNELRGTVSEAVRLPDGSGAFTASWPLPKSHWLYADGPNDPPMSMRVGVGPKRNELADQIRAATKYAIRASTVNGKEPDFDPDAMVQNMIVGLLGYWTETGHHGR